jgi:hypothetical protein
MVCDSRLGNSASFGIRFVDQNGGLAEERGLGAQIRQFACVGVGSQPLRWFWSITVFVGDSPGVTTNGWVATLLRRGLWKTGRSAATEIGLPPLPCRREAEPLNRLSNPQVAAAILVVMTRLNPVGLLFSRACRVGVLCLQVLSRHACLAAQKPRPVARNGCTRLSTTASAFRKIGKRVRLYSRPGNDLTKRFPLIVEA